MAQAKKPVKRTYQAVLDWQDESRRAFGKMLLNWRRRNGWTQYTACEWGTEAEFEVISYGNLSVIEQGKAGELRQKAFFQLEELNRRLDDGPRKLEGVKTQRLKDQLKDAEPLRGDDGKLWDAVDFWSCYIGYVPVPKAYQKRSGADPDAEARRGDLSEMAPARAPRDQGRRSFEWLGRLRGPGAAGQECAEGAPEAFLGSAGHRRLQLG